jgi:hypothetical protein
LWPVLQIFPQLGQVFLPFCRIAARSTLFVDALNRCVPVSKALK